jgi:hypothetical protein
LRLSPDGTSITYVHDNTVWVMTADGAGKHQVSDRTGTTPRQRIVVVGPH